MAAVLPPQNAMSHTSSLGSASSLTSRRTATSNLPGPLELPINSITAKFNNSTPISAASNVQQPPSSINNLLTPPSNIPGESLSPISSGSATTSNPAANGLPPYTPGSYWPSSGSGLTPYLSSGTGTTPQPQQPNQQSQPWSSFSFPPPRGRFSPSLTSIMRTNATSPASSEHPAPSYDLGALPPFPNTISPPTTLPAAGSPQQNIGYNVPSQAPLSGVPNQVSAVNPTENYLNRLPPTPTYYSGSQPSSTPQQAQFPPFSTASPPHQSPPTNAPGNRISPLSQPIQQFNRPFQPYGMPGTIMPSMHGPSGSNHQMSLVGGRGMMPVFNSGHAAHMQQMYGSQPGQQPVDRPFKCDQCPQSFNRNHDLKRHKRIHLAVKPFPCGHCDKSFSRKDALKRHILVKGCGKASNDSARKTDSSSPDMKDESSGEEDSSMPSG